MNDVFKELIVVKRSGQRVSFNGTKVAIAIDKGFDSVYDKYDVKNVNEVYEEVLKTIALDYKDRKTINVEDIQNIIEECLKKLKYNDVYESFSQYRLRRARSRDVFEIKSQHKFLKAIEKVGYLAREANNKKPNELIDRFAKIISKEFATAYLIEGKVEKALEEGVIYLNDLRNYSIGNTSSSHLNIDFENFDNIEEYINEIIRVILLVKQDQYKEQTLMNFDSILKNKLINDFKDVFYEEYLNNLKINGLDVYIDKVHIKDKIRNINTISNKDFLEDDLKNNVLVNIFNITYDKSITRIKRLLKNNINKLFTILESSINNEYKKIIICLDNDGSFESNLIIESYLDNLKETDKILTNIYINKDNEEILKKIFEKSKIANIHFTFENDKDIGYFSHGERIYENVNGIATSKGRTINSACTINLARIALRNKDIKDFLLELDQVMEINKNALVQRFEIQASKYKENYNILFEKGLLYDSDKLEDHQKIRKVLRNGAFIMGYSGLTEAVFLLNDNKINKITKEDFELMLKIVKTIKNRCKDLTNELKLNFIPTETYDKEINRKFIQIDKSVFGIKNIINKDAYEPVYKFINEQDIPLDEKIDMLSEYEKVSSNVSYISIKKKSDYKEFINVLDKMGSKRIKYGGVKYDN